MYLLERNDCWPGRMSRVGGRRSIGKRWLSRFENLAQIHDAFGLDLS
jgi:hypothetical protein